MSAKLFLTITAVIAVLYGLAFVFMPSAIVADLWRSGRPSYGARRTVFRRRADMGLASCSGSPRIFAIGTRCAAC